MIYTSGSTGRPKGVAIPHRAVVRLVCETRLRLAAARRRACSPHVSTSPSTRRRSRSGARCSTAAALVVIRRDDGAVARAARGARSSPADHAVFLDHGAVQPDGAGGAGGVRRPARCWSAARPSIRAVRRRSCAAAPPERLLNALRPDRDHDLRPSGAWSTRLRRGGDGADRPADRQHRGATCSTPAWAGRRWACPASCSSAATAWPAATSAGRPDRRAVRARSRSARPGARLYRTGDLARCLPDGGHRVPRPHRPPGQGARLPHRAGRDRGGARAPPGSAGGGGARARSRRPATGGWSPAIVGTGRARAGAAAVPGGAAARAT